MYEKNFFISWEDISLFIYSILKAFLPLPSLEVMLTPLCLSNPNKWLWYSIIGGIGTCVGGMIGYYLACIFGRKILLNLVEEELKKGEMLFIKHGILAVFIGGITPIPDFILSYIAGFMKMPLGMFLVADGGARFLRSILVTFCLKKFKEAIPMKHIEILFSFFIFIWLLYRWYKKKKN